MAVLAINTTGLLSAMFKGNRLALSTICLHKSYVFTTQWRKISWKLCPDLFFRNISRQGGFVAICSTISTDFKTKSSIKHTTNLELKVYFPTGFTHKKMHETFTKFLESSNLQWDESLPFACYWYTIFVSINGTGLNSAWCLDEIQQRDGKLTLITAIGISV